MAGVGQGNDGGQGDEQQDELQAEVDLNGLFLAEAGVQEFHADAADVGFLALEWFGQGRRGAGDDFLEAVLLAHQGGGLACATGGALDQAFDAFGDVGLAIGRGAEHDPDAQRDRRERCPAR